MKKVFVSGCYDIVHAGHIQFFEEARALGDYLIVSFASEPVLWHHKQRKPSIPDEHKKVLLESLRMVDKVILGTGMKKGLDFEEEFLQEKPDILAVTEDDLYSDIKKELCARVGANYVVLPKTPPQIHSRLHHHAGEPHQGSVRRTASRGLCRGMAGRAPLRQKRLLCGQLRHHPHGFPLRMAV